LFALPGFFAVVDSQTSFQLCKEVGVGKVGVEKFWKLGVGVGVGHFTSDSATLVAVPNN